MRNRLGFTLLEIMLAITLTIGFIGAMMAFYHRAGWTRQLLTNDMAATGAQRVLMDCWTTDLEGAMPYSFLQMGLEGTINAETQLPELRFITATLPGPAIWAERRTTDDPIPPEHDLQMVTYRLHSFLCEEKHVHVTGLERICQRVIAPTEVRHDGKDVTPSMFLPQVRFLDIRYSDGTEEFPAWPMSDWDPRDPRRRNLPVAVRVTIGRQELDPGETLEAYYARCPTFSRTIFLTGGTMSLDKTVIRGGPGRGGMR